jgi:hypothetical protein
MIMSEYEERFRPSAQSLHQTFAATRGRNRGRRRHRRIWVAAAAVGVLWSHIRLHRPIPFTVGQAARVGRQPLRDKDRRRLFQTNSDFFSERAGERC